MDKYVYNQNVGMKVQVTLRNGAILDSADLGTVWLDGGAAGLQKLAVKTKDTEMEFVHVGYCGSRAVQCFEMLRDPILVG